MFEHLSQHVRRMTRQPTNQLNRAQRWVRYLFDLARHCAKELANDRAEQMAAALTYRTIFALIPLFVLGLVVFRMFGGFEDFQTNLQRQLYKFFGVPEVAYVDDDLWPGERVFVEAPDLEEAIERERTAQEKQAVGTALDPHELAEKADDERQVRASIQKALTELTAKVANLSFTSIGVVGVAVFIYAALALAISVEHDFNIIFKSPRGRPWHLRVAIYWSIVTLGSALLALSLYLTGQLVQWVGGLGVYAAVLALLSRLLAFLASWVLLFLLYCLMPNTHVHLRPAVIGSFVAALLWEAGKAGFQAYVTTAVPYSALYGALGLIPLFLFWIYISWLIVLFGLELAYTLQVMHGKLPERGEDPAPKLAGDPEWFIPILAIIGQAFVEGKTIGRQELAERLGLPSRTVNDFASELENAGMIHCLNADGVGDAAYALARPPETIQIADVLELGHQLSRTQQHGPHEPDWSYVHKLHRAQRDAVADVSLARLIEEGQKKAGAND